VTARRTVALSALIVALGAAAVAVVWWLDRTASAPAVADAAGPGSTPGATPGDAAGTAQVGLAIPAAATAVEPTAPPTPPPAAGVRVTRSAPAVAAWKDVPVATRLADLGPGTARPVYDALAAARAQMDTCFAKEPVRPTGADPNAGYQGPAVLVLRIESREDGLDVVDTEVESQGTSSAQGVACVRTVLSSWPIPAPGATSGKRYRLRYPIPQ
jgi:hypothetical protein